MLERELKLTGAPIEAAALELRLGKLALGPRGKPEEALDWFSRALKHRWMDAEAITGLEALLLRQVALRPRIAEVLEPVYREQKNGAKLAEALELQVPVSAPLRQLSLLDELAALRESLGDLPRAFAARQELYGRTPQDARARDELERLADATARGDVLLTLFRKRLAGPLPDDEATGLWRRVAQRSRQADDWEEVAKRLPDDAAPLVTLCALYEASQAFQHLPRLFARRIALTTSSEEKIALQLELAELCEQRLDDAAQAIEALRAALHLGALNALPPLERLLDKQARWEELGQLIQWRVEQTSDAAEQLSLTARLARLEHRARQSDDRALTLLRAVLEREPRHEEAQRVLEEILQCDRPAAGEAAVLLESFYADKPALLVEALEVRVQWAHPDAKTALLHRIADLHGDDPGEAFNALARALREDPDDEEAFRKICGPESAQREPLAGLLAEIAPRAKSNTQKLAMLVRLAQLREKLGQNGSALDAWRSVLELQGDHLDALKAASRLLEASAQWPEQLTVLERMLKLAQTVDERAELLERIGMLRDDSLADAAGAHETFRRAARAQAR